MLALQGVRRGTQAITRMERIIGDLAAEVQARGPPAHDDMSIAARLLRLSDPTTGGPLSQERLAREFAIFFVAGAETTGATRAPPAVPSEAAARWQACMERSAGDHDLLLGN